MAEAGAGAWQNGGGGQPNHHHHVAVTGIPSVMYNPPPGATSGTGKGAAITSVTLRLLTVVFTVVAFSVIASNKGTETWQTYYVRSEGYGRRTWTIWWKVLNSSSGIFILSANVIVCSYSLVQLVVSMVRACSGLPMLPGPTSAASTVTFLFDQVMTYMMMGACGAGASTVMFYSTYAHEYEVGCDDGFTIFCDKYVGSVVMSFLAFACMALTGDLHYVYRVYKIATKRA